MLRYNPKRTLPICLDSDADAPEATRPTFLCRVLSTDDLIDFLEEYERLKTVACGNRAWRSGIVELLARAITGWRNVPHPDGSDGPYEFTPGRLSAVLVPGELRELVRKVIDSTELDPKKKAPSDSSPTLPPEPSAATAVAPAAA